VNDDDEPLIGGFSIISGDLRDAHSRHRMEMQSREARCNHFLDSLNVEQLVALREILNMDEKSPMNNWVDGQAYTLLRRVHGVDPHTGLTEQEALEQAATEKR
jgi:hypothetical protein